MTLEEQLISKLKEIEDCNSAWEFADREIQNELRAASHKLAETLAPDNKRIVTAMTNGLVAYQIAALEYVDFLDAVEATGASTGPLRPCLPTRIGHPRDPNSALYWAFKEFREAGHIDMKQIPVALR